MSRLTPRFDVPWSVCVFSVLLSCSQTAPPKELQPVSGVVIGLDGKPMTSGGMIEFRLKNDRSVRSTAGFNQVGEFQLQSDLGNNKVQGAKAGEYEVTIYPSAAKFVEPITVPGTITIAPQQQDRIEIKVGGGNR